MADNDMRRTAESDDGTRTFRRSMLKATGATVVAGAGLVGASGPGSAQGFSDDETIEIDDGGLTGGWEADGSLPVEDEVFVFIHGWFGDTTVESQAEDVLEALEDGGYEADEAVALEWPATTINFFGAESDTEYVGEIAAGLLEDFYDDGGGNVRLVGHSLGGRCVLWAATKLCSGYESETVAPLGAAKSAFDRPHVGAKGAKLFAAMVEREMVRALPETRPYFKDGGKP